MNNKGTRKILPLLMAAILAFSALTFAPGAASAATAQPIPSGANVTISTAGLYDISTADNGATITVSVNGVALTGTHGNLSVVISANVTLTLKDASIRRTGGTPIQAGGTGCGLVLVGNNSAVAAGNNCAGVNVPDTASLTIEGPGSLTAQGGASAGIGGNDYQSNGAITIRHATVVASGGVGGAGIGGGLDGSGNNIRIVNSSITANGGGNATSGAFGGGAGIGGGGGGGSGGGGSANITVETSVVVATGGAGSALGGGGGAGIGGGGGRGGAIGSSGGAGSNITIDAYSSVQTMGGGGDDDAPITGSGGGGGAGLGGGGGGGKSSGNGGSGGAASNITIAGNELAANSGGGIGGNGGSSSGGGGNGALCGSGGGGGTAGATGNAGNDFDLGGGTYASVGSETVDLLSRPDTSYAGFPALPSVTNPSDQMVAEGSNASFSVTPGGRSPYFYQWQSSSNGSSWTDITDGGIYSAAQTDTLALTGVQFADNGLQFRCIVNDSTWSNEATSGAATLAVQPNVTFTPLPGSMNLNNFTDLVFQADAPALLSAYAFDGVAFQNVTAGTGFGQTIGSSYGVTYNPITGALTVPAAAFGQHVSVGGGYPLTPGTYRARITFWDSASLYLDYYADFVMTDEAAVNPAMAAFDKYASSAGYLDVSTTLTPGSYTLSNVTLGGTALAAGTHYTVSGNVFTFRKEYLATLGTGAQAFAFNMSGGASPAFTVTVSDSTPAPAASASVLSVTVSGTVGSALGGGQTAAITLSGDTASGNLVNVDASGWFTGLPAGITVAANAQAGANTITLTFSGTPTVASVQQFAITIPGNILAGGNAITVAANPNARFNISAAPQPPSPLPKTGDDFPMGVLLALLGVALTGMGWLGTRLRKQKNCA